MSWVCTLTFVIILSFPDPPAIVLFLAAAGGKKSASPDLQGLKPLKLKDCFPAILSLWGQDLF